ncbi:hypothetical protein I1E95_05810 [Synechococcus sp. CBW1107]|uniref:hypothetical protein n=1 Tax=Synechococcus sp. CBW1107 TaxID=2789857 RepID=UPI0018CF51F7|nr:hypothetical protein [Synechococcus sp. CBW1107]QPN57604.1 hypothetical protein I1E95_05810 [Synechococcus sp. CBW1107]
MTYLAPIADDQAQTFSGGVLNRSFNVNREDNRSYSFAINVNIDNSDNSVNTDNSVRNNGPLSGNSISVAVRLIRRSPIMPMMPQPAV